MPLVLVEDFRPFHESIEWRVASAYWDTQGFDAFFSGQVPHLATNDGARAGRAADVLFESCRVAEQRDELEERITVAEVGAGLGTFSLVLLDRFRRRCEEQGAGLYDRLDYLVADAAAGMLRDLAAFDVFARHEGHVRLCRVDALRPDEMVDAMTGQRLAPLRCRAIVYNYLLDVLPVSMLARSDGGWLSLHTRTWLPADRVGLLTGFESSDPEARVEAMMQLSDAFRVERSYLAVDESDLPFAQSAKSLATEHAEATGRELATVVLPWGAASSLLTSMGLLIDGGFVLFNDYGYADPEMGTATYERYGDSRSVALNLELLERIVVAEAAVPLAYVAPPGDAGTDLHVRMVCRPADTELQECFCERFDGATFHGLAGDLDEAEAARRSGDYERAAAVYEDILARFPENWCVVLGLAETALAAGDLAAAVAFAEKAVEMNPAGSLAVHEVLGDALAGSGRLAEAEVVYRRVLAMAPSSRASSGLAWVLSQRGDFSGAIAEIARGLDADRLGASRPALQEALRRVLEERAARTSGRSAIWRLPRVNDR